jgi:hypothetical protein
MTAVQLHDFLRDAVALRAGEGLGRIESVLELAEFIVSKHGDVIDGIKLLHGLPLLLLADETIGTFGATRCFFDHAELLPHKPELFIHYKLRLIIQKACTRSVLKNVMGLDSVVKTIGVPCFSSSDLVQFRETAHATPECVQNKVWREQAFQLILQSNNSPVNEADLIRGLRTVLADFASWNLVCVVNPAGDDALVPLHDLSKVFSLDGIDRDFEPDLSKVLSGCGIYVLYVIHRALFCKRRSLVDNPASKVAHGQVLVCLFHQQQLSPSVLENVVRAMHTRSLSCTDASPPHCSLLGTTVR